MLFQPQVCLRHEAVPSVICDQQHHGGDHHEHAQQGGHHANA